MSFMQASSYCMSYLGTHSPKTPKEPVEAAQPENLRVCVKKLFNQLYGMVCVVLPVNVRQYNIIIPCEVGRWQFGSDVIQQGAN